MNRFSTVRGARPNDVMECCAWVVVGSDGSLRLNRGEPTVGRGEISVAVTLTVPMSLFRKPLLRARIDVPPQAGITEAEAIKAVVDIIEAGCDFEVAVTADPAGGDDGR